MKDIYADKYGNVRIRGIPHLIITTEDIIEIIKVGGTDYETAAKKAIKKADSNV